MNFLEKRIVEEGIVKANGLLSVDAFLNHQMDMALIDQIAAELHSRFAGLGVTRILTIEVSGIPLACALGRMMGVPVVYAKKSKSRYTDDEVYAADVPSFRHKNTNRIIVGRKYLTGEDKVLIVDDIMANGCALQGLISIVEDAEAEVIGCGIAIEKAFQEGGDRIRNLGYRLESVAIIEEMNPLTGGITFRR